MSVLLPHSCTARLSDGRAVMVGRDTDNNLVIELHTPVESQSGLLELLKPPAAERGSDVSMRGDVRVTTFALSPGMEAAFNSAREGLARKSGHSEIQVPDSTWKTIVVT